MKLPFRQGIIDAQKNGLGQAQFLLPSSTPGFVSLAAALTSLSFTVAHGSSNYLVTFNQNVDIAWGPVVPGVNNYLYWNVDLTSAAVTYGITTLEPIASSVEPVAPPTDQHWFDLNTTTMRFWNGTKWINCVRLFAGMIPNGNLGSNQTAWCYPLYQAWLNIPALQVETVSGYIATNIFGVPARMPNMEFFTSKTLVRYNTTVGTSGVLSQPTSAIFPVRASENIPAMSVVYISGENLVGLASGNAAVNPPKVPMGMVQCALMPGEVGLVHQSGEISCDTWDWSTHIGKPLYCGDNGEFVTTRPNGLMAWRVGVVKNRNTIIFHVDAETTPQIYEVSGSDVIVNGAAPLSSVLTITPLNEKIWDISIPPATSVQAGYMTTSQASQLISLDSRLDQAELDIIGKAPLVHTHAISSVTGLQGALDGKSPIGHLHSEYSPIGHLHSEYAPVVHTHTIVDVSGLQVELNGKAPLIHVHGIADVTGLQTALDAKIDEVPTAVAGNFAAFTATGNIEDSNVNMTTLSNTFAFANHTHSISHVTGLQTALDGKAPTVHTHLAASITDFDEAVDDRVAALIVPGDFITTLYDDTANTLTITGVGDSLFVFQVGAILGGHIHHAVMTTEQAQYLIHNTSNIQAVADSSQPFVVLSTELNGNPGDEHIHEITVFFDYVNSTFVVTDITNNALDNHIAKLIGDGSTPPFVPSLLTQVVTLGSAAVPSAFTLRTTEQSMQYWNTYLADQFGYLQPWGGEFDQTSIGGETTVSFPTPLDFAFEGTGISLAAIGNTPATAPETAIEIVINQVPTGQFPHQYFVGYFFPVVPFDPLDIYGGQSGNAAIYWSNEVEAQVQGYGGIGSDSGLAPWQPGDVIGLIATSNGSVLRVFKNGVFVAELGLISYPGGYVMVGGYTPF